MGRVFNGVIISVFGKLFGMGKGVRNHPTKFQNRDIAGFLENLCFVRSNGRKTTFEWPKVVSEVLQSVFVFSFR